MNLTRFRVDPVGTQCLVAHRMEPNFDSKLSKAFMHASCKNSRRVVHAVEASLSQFLPRNK